MRTFFIAVILTAAVFTACEQQELGQAPLPDDYLQQVEEWKSERVESLTAQTGWMRLAGMYWLNEGENTFGSAPDNDIQFPIGTIPAYTGVFIVENGQVRMVVENGMEVTYENELVDEMIIYDGDHASEIMHGSLEWVVIERGDLMGIRLYNKDNEKVDQFTGFETYPVDPEWRREARFVPNPEGSTISIINVLGQQEDVNSPGYLEFTINEELYTLDAIESTDQMFIIVGDETNRTETYQAGRYMYIDYPEEGSDLTVIDFNKVYNPPCAFSKFTTCQRPPPQNRLDVEIKAGELRPVGWDGL